MTKKRKTYPQRIKLEDEGKSDLWKFMERWDAW